MRMLACGRHVPGARKQRQTIDRYGEFYDAYNFECGKLILSNFPTKTLHYIDVNNRSTEISPIFYQIYIIDGM